MKSKLSRHTAGVKKGDVHEQIFSTEKTNPISGVDENKSTPIKCKFVLFIQDANE